jgi:2-dehydro-3-deoxyphosphogluconate aldolase/(4S)-4-hydroxy-2-oxoglutarate aldolase
VEHILNQIGNAGVIAILRSKSEEFISEHLPRLAGAGLRVIEVSRSAENYADSLSALVSKWGQKLIIGVGTIRTRAEAEDAIASGAEFLISPHFNPDLTKFLVGRGVPYIVGCYTPSEISAALDLGPAAIKIFPAFLGGPRYIRALLMPFPDARLVPTGGVSPADAADYWRAGAWAVAIGSEMNSILGDTGWSDEQVAALFTGKSR